MKIYLDTEFMENGETVKPLSIAMLAETGQSIYMVISDAPREEANEFVQTMVLPYIDIPPFDIIEPIQNSTYIASEGVQTYVRCPKQDAGTILKNWVAKITHQPEFWAWFATYDWLIICQLYGHMTDIPRPWPMYVNDLRTNPNSILTPFEEPNLDIPPHHALHDVHALKNRWEATHA